LSSGKSSAVVNGQQLAAWRSILQVHHCYLAAGVSKAGHAATRPKKQVCVHVQHLAAEPHTRLLRAAAKEPRISCRHLPRIIAAAAADCWHWQPKAGTKHMASNQPTAEDDCCVLCCSGLLFLLLFLILLLTVLLLTVLLLWLSLLLLL
jgi:hypothetical protein